jgi:hypothetical protein
MPKAILLKPLDGFPEGAEREFEQPDFDRLKDMGAVRAASGDSAKAAPAVENKAAPSVANKATTGRPRKVAAEA